MTITVTASGISLDGPLVAGEVVAVSVSGVTFEEDSKPTLCLLGRFPDALLASVELAESETAGTWTGELDTATKQTALFFATARADERRDAALELVAGRVSLARLTVPMANSALCPKPDGSPFASPVYIPVPGPQGEKGDPGTAIASPDGMVVASIQNATNEILLAHPYRAKWEGTGVYAGTHRFDWAETDSSALDNWPAGGPFAGSLAYLESGKSVADFNAGIALAVRMLQQDGSVFVGVRSKNGDLNANTITAYTGGVWRDAVLRLVFYQNEFDSIAPTETR